MWLVGDLMDLPRCVGRASKNKEARASNIQTSPAYQPAPETFPTAALQLEALEHTASHFTVSAS